MALARVGHAVPHIPQWVVLTRVSASQPLAALMSQSAKPGSQVKPQAPAAQVDIALALAGHALPQVPQCARVVRVSTSQPLAALMSQLPKPSEHEATEHAPTLHTGEPLLIVQLIPQPPQLPVLVRMSTQPPPQQVCPARQPRMASQPGTHWLPMQR